MIDHAESASELYRYCQRSCRSPRQNSENLENSARCHCSREDASRRKYGASNQDTWEIKHLHQELQDRLHFSVQVVGHRHKSVEGLECPLRFCLMLSKDTPLSRIYKAQVCHAQITASSYPPCLSCPSSPPRPTSPSLRAQPPPWFAHTIDRPAIPTHRPTPMLRSYC